MEAIEFPGTSSRNGERHCCSPFFYGDERKKTIKISKGTKTDWVLMRLTNLMAWNRKYEL